MTTVKHLLQMLKARSLEYEAEQFQLLEGFVARTCRLESAVKVNISSYAQQFTDDHDDEFLTRTTDEQSMLLHCPVLLHVMARHAIAFRIVTQLRKKMISTDFTRNITLSDRFSNAHVRDQGALMRDYIANSPALDFELCEKFRIRITFLANNQVTYPIRSANELIRFKRVVMPLMQPLQTRISELTSESDNAWDLDDKLLYTGNDFSCVISRQLENVVDTINHITKSCELWTKQRPYFNSWSTLSALRQLKQHFCSHATMTTITPWLEQVLAQTTCRTSFFYRLPLEITMQHILVPMIRQVVDDTYDLPEEFLDMVDDVNEQCGPIEDLMATVCRIASKV